MKHIVHKTYSFPERIEEEKRLVHFQFIIIFTELVRERKKLKRKQGEKKDEKKDREKERESGAQWFKSAKIQDVSTGPLARPFAHSLALLTCSLAHLFTRSLTSLTPSLMGL